MDLARALKTAAVSSTNGSSDNTWNLDYVEPDDNSALNWDVSNRLQRGQTSVSGDTATLRDLFIKPDGTKLYTCGETSDKVFQYTLDPAWSFNDITLPGTSYYQISGTGQLNPYGLYFKPDGTKMYTMARNNDTVNEYDLSTAWDVTTASHNDQFAVGSQEASPDAIHFKTDGTKMYIMGRAGDDINEYTLSTAWDITTASYSQKASLTSQETGPCGFYFKSDGTSVWVVGTQGDDINEYSMSTAWDISTLSYVQNAGLGGAIDPMGVFFKPDGSRFYIAKSASPDAVREYYVSIKRLSVNAQEINPRGIFFKPDGTKLYVIGNSGNDVNEYNLSTAWDVDTATYSQAGSVSAQETAPRSVYFKSDGTTMYICGVSGDDVNQYSLSTAWDVSTLSYVQNFSVSAQELNPEGITFKSDGTKMYICGLTDYVYEYNLSTAWDISTASFSQSYDITEALNPTEVQFKDDGTKMFICERSTNFDGIYEYALSTAWDVTSATYTTFFRAPENSPESFAFKPDGTKLYIVGTNTDTITQYTVG